MKRRVLAVLLFSALTAFLLFPSSGSGQDKAKKIDAVISGCAAADRFNGAALVAENGKVIFKKGYGLANMEWDILNTPDTKFRLGSINKQFTSMLVMQLVAEGKISLDGVITDYLPWYREDTGKKVTIHHLLTHTSGIPSYTDQPGFFINISRNYYPMKKFVKEQCSGDLEFEPGSKYKYDNSGYFILGAILHEVTGKQYDVLLQERIFKPLNMENSGYDRHKTILKKRAGAYRKTAGGYENDFYLDMSIPYAAGALYSTVEDLYLWDRALYTEMLLNNELKGKMFTPYLNGYAYGWMIRNDDGHKTILHGGGINGFNTLIVRMPDEQHLIVLLNNTGRAQLGEIAGKIKKILYGEENGTPSIQH